MLWCESAIPPRVRKSLVGSLFSHSCGLHWKDGENHTMPSFYKPTFSTDRFKELMLYAAHEWQREQFFGRTILNKTFFFSDFLAFGLMGEPITGATYIRRPNGPVPRELNWMAKELQESKDAMFVSERVFNYTQQRLSALRPANTNVFNTEQLDLINGVIKNLSSQTAKDVSDLSHDRSFAWEVADEGEEIPYTAVFLSRHKPTKADIQRGLELAKEYGWLESAK